MSITITITLPDDLAAAAREQGLLEPEAIQALLQGAMENRSRITQDSLEETLEAMEPVRQAFREEYPGITEDEVWQLIDDIRHDRLA